MHELSALLRSGTWITRRVDRVEFLDLTTVHRTIVVTLDLRVLARTLPRSGTCVPLGWFASGARAGTRLADARGTPVPYLGRKASDARVLRHLGRKLSALGIPPCGLAEIPRHRDDDAGRYEELAKDARA